MRRALLLFGTLLPALVMAQTPMAGVDPAPVTPKDQAIQAFSVQTPDEGSPFFAERQNAKSIAASKATSGTSQATGADALATYPRVKNSPDSATAILGQFFTGMFSSVNLHHLKAEKTTQKLTVLPEEFSTEKRHELDTTYTVRNNTGKMMRFDYTTTQRVEVVTKDGNGNVIDKMSDDRSIKPQEGIVILNPKERLEYVSPVATRDMKPGQTYTIQADVTGYPEYTVSKKVTPTP